MCVLRQALLCSSVPPQGPLSGGDKGPSGWAHSRLAAEQVAGLALGSASLPALEGQTLATSSL